jgi:hypothetical protein
MIEARDLLERRLLAALEQAAMVELPAAWRPRPAKEALRPAAAVVLRVASCGSRDEMVRELRATAARIAANREGRLGGERELWSSLAGAIERLGETGEEAQGLLGLRLWKEVEGVAIREIWSALRLQLPAQPAAGEDFLAALSRVLLRALARRWSDEARQEGGS